jgi:NADP-dependent 3-hydroxy acid dehydrogenase YdfG
MSNPVGTVLITGCSTGFGEATARLFASRGWNVVATMRRPETGSALAALDNVLVTRLDVQDQSSIERAIAAGIVRFGRLDVVVNNAGFGLFGVFEATSRERVLEQFEVNVFGLMDVTRAILPQPLGRHCQYQLRRRRIRAADDIALQRLEIRAGRLFGVSGL